MKNTDPLANYKNDLIYKDSKSLKGELLLPDLDLALLLRWATKEGHSSCFFLCKIGSLF